MGRLIKNELYKAFHLKKLILLMLVALAIDAAAALQGTPKGSDFPILLFDNLPDSWVDEYRSGVLKLSLLRPVNRTALLNAKVISFWVCAAALMGFTLLSAYAVGAIEVRLMLQAGAVTLIPVLGFGLLVLFIAVLTHHMAITVGCTAWIMKSNTR